MRFFVVMALAATVPLGIGTLANAGDWPQILGPNRDGRAINERALAAWPESGLQPDWKVPLGSGFAGPAIAGGRVVVFHRVGSFERIDCLEAQTGQRKWSTKFAASYRASINPDNGPRCVPLIHGDRVICFGAAGDLYCVSLADGQTLWSRSAYADYQGDEGYFGAGSTPLVVGDFVLVNVGGRRGAGIVAFDLTSGETKWKATDEAASYSSPTVWRRDGKASALFVTRLNVVLIDPSSGKVLGRVPFGQRGPTVNAATPLICDGQPFVSASYGIGARMGRLDAKPQWANDQTLSSQYCTAVFHKGYLFGTHGREDGALAELRCVEAKSGRVAWSRPNVGVSHVLLVGEHIVGLGSTGKLFLFAASHTAYREVSSHSLPVEVTRALPALSDSRLYLRTNRGAEGELWCLPLPTRGDDEAS